MFRGNYIDAIRDFPVIPFFHRDFMERPSYMPADFIEFLKARAQWTAERPKADLNCVEVNIVD